MKKGLLFVSAQFACLAYLLLAGKFWISTLWGLAFHFAGGILGIWAILEMSKAKLAIPPEVRPNTHLIQSGPYAKIRHPMYTSLLLYFAPYLSLSVSFQMVYLLLLLTLLFKLRYEEKLLLEAFPNYQLYQAKSWRLLPWVY